MRVKNIIVGYTETVSVNYEPIQSTCSISAELEEGESYRGAMVRARRIAYDHVQDTLSKAQELRKKRVLAAEAQRLDEIAARKQLAVVNGKGYANRAKP